MKLIKKAIKLAADKIGSKQYEDTELICEQVLKVRQHEKSSVLVTDNVNSRFGIASNVEWGSIEWLFLHIIEEINLKAGLN